MIEHCDTNTFIKLRLTRASGEVVQPLWLCLAVLRKHGFKVFRGGIVRSGPAGKFLIGGAYYVEDKQSKRAERDALRFAAMRRVAEELGQEAVAC
jgi:hypothetical protein